MNVLSFQKTISSGWIKPLLMALFVIFLISNTQAQTIAAGNDGGDPIYNKVDQSGQFPGGLKEFYTYLAKAIRYPAQAVKENVQGKVFLTFVIEKDGSISHIIVLRGIGSGCDEEAARVIKASPKWTPAMQGGQAVRQQYTMPVSFTLMKTM